MRRAAPSIPANIAEGFAKRSKPDKARYMTDELRTMLEEVSQLPCGCARSILASGS